MAGDKFNIRVASGWSGTSPTNSQTNVYADLFSSVTNGLAAHSTGKATAAALQSPAAGIGSALTAFLNSQPAASNTPKAYLAWLLFDEQFQLVSTGAQQVGASGATTLHVVNGQLVTKSGYLYVYVSNEATNMDVFFDNLQVTHIQGALLEETHYYPFGLTMAGISSKAAGKLENKFKFNDGTELENKEFSDGSGLELYSTDFRSYDAQIGRFHQIDPLTEFSLNWSGYSYVQNNPLLFNDPLGLDTLRRNSDGSLPTSRPDGSSLQDDDVILDDQGKLSNYFNGEGWQVPGFSNVDVVAKKKTKKSYGEESNTGQAIAERLIRRGRITFNDFHPAPPNPRFRNDLANADDNIRDAAAGQQVHTSQYGHARGALVTLDPRLLRLLEELSRTYELEVSELAGGRHGSNSRHYAGIAVDITRINGRPVNARNPYYQQLMRDARNLGATEILGPGQPNHGGHIHLGMPRR